MNKPKPWYCYEDTEKRETRLYDHEHWEEQGAPVRVPWTDKRSNYPRLREYEGRPIVWVSPVVPEVGMGATKIVGGYADRYAYTIVEILSPTKIKVQRDKSVCLSETGKGWAHYEDKSAKKFVVTLRRNGTWVQKGHSIGGGCGEYLIGHRVTYLNPSY